MDYDLILERWGSHPDHGSLGEFWFEGAKLAETIEPPWNNNAPFVSCVPCGTYELIPFTRGNGDEVYALFNPEKNVYIGKDDRPFETDRYAILIHPANWAKELQGCIAAGTSLGIAAYKNNKETLQLNHSRTATNQIINIIETHNIKFLTIVNQSPESWII